jgi:hypothetical protein
MQLHEKAVAAATNAAFAVSESETWFLGGYQPSNKTKRAWSESREDWIGFARQNRLAPAEALWIRAGALGFHKGKVAYADLPPMIRLAFETFHRVLNDVSDALDQAAKEEAERQAAEEAAAERAARPKTAPDLEGTPLEPFPDPAGPSEFARKPAQQEKTDDAAE